METQINRDTTEAVAVSDGTKAPDKAIATGRIASNLINE
jgi:hypothetical protein